MGHPGLTRENQESGLSLAQTVRLRTLALAKVAAFMLDAVERRSHVTEIVGLGR